MISKKKPQISTNYHYYFFDNIYLVESYVKTYLLYINRLQGWTVKPTEYWRK